MQSNQRLRATFCCNQYSKHNALNYWNTKSNTFQSQNQLEIPGNDFWNFANRSGSDLQHFVDSTPLHKTVFINQLRKQETGLVRKPKWTGTVTKYRLI
jgi:hypothetical protein